MDLPDKPLFFYGTLRDLDVLGTVLGRRVPASRLEPARLPGHRVARVPDESYPVLVVAAGDAAEGVVFDDFAGAEDMERILFFESFEYAPMQRTVIAEQRGSVQAQVFAEAQMLPGAAEPWSLEHWQRRHKPRFLEMTRRYMALFGEATLEEADALWEELEQDATALRRHTG